MGETLPRFVEMKCDESVDWLKIVREKFLDMEFKQLVQSCGKSDDIVAELRDVYVACMYRELTDSPPEMRHVILWQLEKQFGTAPSDNDSLNAIEKELVKQRTSRQHDDDILSRSFLVSPTVIDKITYILTVNISAEDFIKEIQLDETCPVIIYNQLVRCCHWYHDASQLPVVERDTCYLLYKGTWIHVHDGKISFQLRRVQQPMEFMLNFTVWLEKVLPNVVINVNKNLFNGYFIMPQVYVDWISFLDHILLDKQLQYIVYDEHNLSNKKWHTFKVRLDDASTPVTVNACQKRVHNNAAKIVHQLGMPVDLFPFQSHYVKINFSRLEDIVVMEPVKSKFSKVLYYTQHRSVVAKYARILPSIVFHVPPPTDAPDRSFSDTVVAAAAAAAASAATEAAGGDTKSTNKLLKRLVPEIFLINYPRKCLHLPRLLADHESREGGMQFPIHGEPSEPRWYSCNHHEKAIYPGLRKNPLQNNASFPVIPCCYISDQRLKMGSEFRKYYLNDDDNTKKKHVKENVTYSTNRMVPADVTGTLSKPLSFLFWAVYQDSFHRYGVDKSSVSILDCCTLATERPKPTLEWLSNHREYLAQEIDMMEEEASAAVWIDPRVYLRLIERWYGVNVVLFENQRDVSHFSQINVDKRYYAAFRPYSHTVYIIINHGFEADDAHFPQCELLWQNVDDVRRFVFPQPTKILDLFDEFNQVQRVKQVEGVTRHSMNASGNVYFVYRDDDDEKIACDPPHPPYFEALRAPVVEQPNLMSDYLNGLQSFETSLLDALTNGVSDSKVIDDFVSRLSQNTKKKVLSKRRFFDDIMIDIRRYNGQHRIFYNIKDFVTYCKFYSNDIILFSDRRLLNNMILALEPFDKEQLSGWIERRQSFRILATSLFNPNYFKEYYYGSVEPIVIVVVVDNLWFKRVSHDEP